MKIAVAHDAHGNSATPATPVRREAAPAALSAASPRNKKPLLPIYSAKGKFN
jgi:hypothetical protein